MWVPWSRSLGGFVGSERAAMTPELQLQALVARLRELEAKATPGPWRVHDDGAVRLFVIQRPAVWLEAIEDNRNVHPAVDCREQDATLIAEARNALPAILDALEKATSRPGARSSHESKEG